MKIILSVIISAAAAVMVSAAPAFSESQGNVVTDEENEQDYYRDKRSQYQQYVSPCAAAAASAPLPAISSPGYPVNLAPYQAYARSNFYGTPSYRFVEQEPEQELLSYSDADHMMMGHIPMARGYGYAGPAGHVPPSYNAVPVTSPSPAPAPVVAMFANTNVGGCAVPLLFSCTPNIVRGEVNKNPVHYAYGNSYRGVDAINQDSTEEHRDKPVVHDQLNPVHDDHHTHGHQ